MNFFEKLALALLGTVVAESPVFVHSKQGSLILNASETLFANIVSVFQAQQQQGQQGQQQPPAGQSAQP